MNPTSNVAPNDPAFSPCSQADVCKTIQALGSCLEGNNVVLFLFIILDPGTRPVINGGICGNGLIDGPEEQVRSLDLVINAHIHIFSAIAAVQKVEKSASNLNSLFYRLQK